MATRHSRSQTSLRPTPPNSKSLLQKIAEGFRKIQDLEGSKQVVLYSTRGAGTNALPSKGFHKSLDSFIREFHTPFREDPLNSELEKALHYSEYKDTLEILYNHTGFTDPAACGIPQKAFASSSSSRIGTTRCSGSN